MDYHSPLESDATKLARAGSGSMACRRMVDDDIEKAANLLCRGFPERPLGYWLRGLGRLRDRPVPKDYPRYGSVIAVGGELVGILLLIFSTTDEGKIRANVSSWYVDPPYRCYAPLLLASSLRYPEVSFINISPAPHTIDTIKAQGFVRYANGIFHAIPALAGLVPDASVRVAGTDDPDVSPVLKTLAAYGCLTFVGSRGAETFPFAFMPRRVFKGALPSAHLVYCAKLSHFAPFAGAIGRLLLKKGIPLVSLDASGPIEGLVGRYFEPREPKYFRGSEPPRFGDISETEFVIFGP